ncbi:hypothetical protein [Agromyces bracchium]|uniref:Protein kinase domain-containing protein n=1 Tax=Agromyces bracchium TaxID=88376 RepID=A0A6I3M643_9MICO|nr:hypothetical protein [Agromyces bracchium]MTH68198.1 hypothetical protein [Agromyces bracchium]
MALRSRRTARSGGPHRIDPVPGPPTADPPSTPSAVLAGYRLLRRLAWGERADVHLAVVERPTGGSPDEPDPAPVLVVVRVYDGAADDEAISIEIEAMEHDPTGTVPRLLDLATLADGRACVVVERIDGRSLASMLEAADLSPGQVVTALAPLVVATRDLGRRGLVHCRLAPSDVLVDGIGRPRLIGLGALERTDARVAAPERSERTRRAHAALLALMETVVAASSAPERFHSPIELARGMLHERPFLPDHEAIERALFAVAEPTPLVVPIRPAYAGTLPSRAVPVPIGLDRTTLDAAVESPHALSTGSEPFANDPTPLGSGGRRRSAARRLAELAQLPGLADGLGEAIGGGAGAAARRRVAAWIRRRPAVLATGGFVGAGALVLLLTAVPPAAAGAGGSEVADRSPVATASGPPTTSPPADWAETGGASEIAAAVEPGDGEADDGAIGTAQADPVEAAASLLEIRAGCLAGRDLACIAAYAQPGAPIEARDLAAIASSEPIPVETADLSAISVTAELGDAIVLSVPFAGEREPASLLMMRSEAGWRLREWFD